MSEKQDFINLIKELENNDYTQIDSYKTLLYLFLSLVQNEESDKDIWYTYITTVIEILKENTEECGETAVVYNFIANDRNSLLHKLNREEYERIVGPEDKYDNMSTELKKILSHRVMCPKSEGKNFRAFF